MLSHDVIANLRKGMLAEGAITAHRMVKGGATDMGVAAISAVTDRPIGVSQDDADAAGETVDVALLAGQLLTIELGDTVDALWTPLTTDSIGRAVAAVAGDLICGYAFGTGVVGDLVTMFATVPGQAEVGVKVATVAADATGTNRVAVSGYRNVLLLAAKASAQAIEIATPAASDVGMRLTVFRTGHNSAVTISTQGDETIAGGATHTACDAIGKNVTVVWSGAHWYQENAVDSFKVETVAVDSTGESRISVTGYRRVLLIASKGSAQAIEIATPAASDVGMRLTVLRTTHASAVTISTQGDETIAGGATHATCDAIGDNIELIWSGDHWYQANTIA